MQSIVCIFATQKILSRILGNVLFLHKCYDGIGSHASEDQLSSNKDRVSILTLPLQLWTRGDRLCMSIGPLLRRHAAQIVSNYETFLLPKESIFLVPFHFLRGYIPSREEVQTDMVHSLTFIHLSSRSKAVFWTVVMLPRPLLHSNYVLITDR